MSKATIVSFFPQEVNEFIPFLFPPQYHIEASDGKSPKVLVIKDAHYFIENRTGDNRPPIEIPVPADQLASSLVYDFINSMMDVDEDRRPAVFWVEGEHTPESVLKTFKDKCTEALAKQKNWFVKLVQIADDEWQRYRQHKIISDLCRSAAAQLGLGDREWASIAKDLTTCPACGTTVKTTQAVCGNCRCIINPEKYKSLTFAGA